MAFQPVPNVIKVSFEGRMDDQDVVNSIYIGKSTPGAITGQNVFDITSLLAQEWIARHLPNVGGQYAHLRTVGTDLTVPDGSQTTVTNSAGVAGGVILGTAVPNNCAFCITLVTGLAGRSQRGRLFIGGIRSGMLNGTNNLSNAAANQILVGVSGVVSIASEETDGVFRAVVVSRFANGQQRPVGVSVPVAGVSFRDLTVDSQRRRLPGRGT